MDFAQYASQLFTAGAMLLSGGVQHSDHLASAQTIQAHIQGSDHHGSAQFVQGGDAHNAAQFIPGGDAHAAAQPVQAGSIEAAGFQFADAAVGNGWYGDLEGAFVRALPSGQMPGPGGSFFASAAGMAMQANQASAAASIG